MPDRIFFALVAAALVLLPSLGNAQVTTRSRPLPNMSAATPLPFAAQGSTLSPAGGFAPAGPAYGADDRLALLDPNHRLQPGDQLSLNILEDHDAAVAISVGQSGHVVVDPIPQPVKVSGMTVAQAASEIKQMLEKDYYYTATVRLNLERAVPPGPRGTVTISGKVNRVGPLPIVGDKPFTCSAAILMAGGFQLYADERRVRVTRREKDGSVKRYTVDVKSVLNEGKVENDMVLIDGDSIFVDSVYFRTS